jgi:type VI secretion system protein ImpA
MYSLDDIKYAVPGAEPAGRDLALTGEILELESMAKPVPTTNVEGKRVSNDFSEHEPDWLKLGARCMDLFKTTRDLRVATFYCAALLRTDGFLGLAHGFELIKRMILSSDYQVHPRFEAGDRAVVLERWYTLAALGSPYKMEGDLLRIIEGLRTVPLAKNKTLPCRYLDVVAARNQPGGVDVAQIERLKSEWRKIAVDERSATCATLGTALGALAEIEAVLLAQTPEDLVPAGAGSRPLQGLALEIKGLMEFMTGSVPQSRTVDAVSKEVSVAVPGEIHSRADAIRLLQQAAEFFRRTEPSSPVPYFVDRAIRLVDRDFMGLLGDLVPDAVPKFQSLTGVEGGATAQN